MIFGLLRLTTLKLYSEALSVSVFHSAEHRSGGFERGRLTWVKGEAQKKHLHSQIPLYHILSTEPKTVHQGKVIRCKRLFTTLNTR
jgi:hypothetical protein